MKPEFQPKNNKTGIHWKYSKQSLKTHILFNSSPGFNDSPAFVKDLFSQTKNTFINISHFIHPGYIHDKCIRHNLIYFENIIAPCISYIMTLHITNILPLSGKGQSTDGYHQHFQVPD